MVSPPEKCGLLGLTLVAMSGLVSFTFGYGFWTMMTRMFRDLFGF